MSASTDYTLRVTWHAGERCMTFESMIAALTKMGEEYEQDGYDDIAEAFRLFAESLVSEALRTQ